jgi:ATP-dependent exoDNAse (exonuclease V), alpha subunit - helicase superfamily I member
MVITHLGQHCIEARILGGDFNNQIWLLPQIKLTTTEGQFPFILVCKQFPIRLCFAMTVNKAQGQSLDITGIDL